MNDFSNLFIGFSLLIFFSCSGDPDYNGGGFTGGNTLKVCEQGNSSGAVKEPQFMMNLKGQTGWFASPLVADLDNDGQNEIIAAYYDIYVHDDSGEIIVRTEDQNSRVYAPHVVTDLDGDGIIEIIAGRGAYVFVWEYIGLNLISKDGWPAKASIENDDPEIRGLAVADLDNDGLKEIAVTTTQTIDEEEGGSQVYVFDSHGLVYQPVNGHEPAWPRYNALPGEGNDAQRNGAGHHGYGCYGLNIGIGNLDNDAEQEILVTYDNHHIQLFEHDGVAVDTAPWFSNRESEYEGNRLTWGQFIRWADPKVEEDHYHLHEGQWPHPDWTEWLQWTASPPSIADLDLDGQNEVIGVPNLEMHTPYQTQAYGIFVLNGNYQAELSGRRKSGWKEIPRGDSPLEVEGWYPPKGITAPAIANINGDEKPEIVVSLNDGFMWAFTATGEVLWRHNYRHGRYLMYSSEPVIADLNQDGSPEIVFTTFGKPDDKAGYLVILAANGEKLWDLPLPNPGNNGNGNGSPSAPTISDLNGDGQLEILVQTFDHGLDIFTVPDSSSNCILWSTSRGNNLRTGSTI
ncbi:MAG: VCBS repeat-containing protein [Deltaproteobacteria bacterium]|jgi:hypothetical protein|nr:VCBS repeat-containing protein [Deltaproteobacteria bacterium]